MTDSPSVREARRPEPDAVLSDIADYALADARFTDEARETARLCLMDSLGCALAALDFPACTRLLGPVVPGATLAGGARVPGTPYELDPVQAAFDIGAMIRWLDFNDTFLAAEWGHPSDNLGAILAVADYLDRRSEETGGPAVTMGDVLTRMIEAHEIQGVIALENSFNRVGLDHVLLVRVASTAVAAAMLGCSREQVVNALSNAWIDGGALRTYRHAPNTGSRKSWAAGDAASRAVRLALMALRGEMGYPSALSARGWGYYDVLFEGRPFSFTQPYGSYVMENVLFKISFPAEFHAQTAVEAALQLHEAVKDRLGDVRRIVLETQEAGVRIIHKTGPLDNPADRDHCLQYMVAIPTSTAGSRLGTTRTRRPQTRGWTPCGKRWRSGRTRASPWTTSTPTSAPSPTPSRSSSATGLPRPGWKSPTPSATGGGGGRGRRCCGTSSSGTCGRGCRRPRARVSCGRARPGRRWSRPGCETSWSRGGRGKVRPCPGALSRRGSRKGTRSPFGTGIGKGPALRGRGTEVREGGA